MENLVTIGEFSRLSHLTAKALRHYHEVGLLTPAKIDSSGYRRYSPAQVQQAHLVRRLRLLEMPVPDVKAVLAAPDEDSRNRTIAEHLATMQETLDRTAGVVASLRSLLSPDAALGVEYRTVGPTSAVGIRAQVHRHEVAAWCGQSYPRIEAALAAAGIDPSGAAGATYDAAFFEQDVGEVLAFIPTAQPVQGVRVESNGSDGQVEPLTLPAGRFAVAVHQGSFEEIDRSYGQLGGHVAERDQALPEPIREHYLLGPDMTPDPHLYRTQIWWPIHPHAQQGATQSTNTPTQQEA